MIQKLQYYISTSLNPHENLAIEQYLADSVGEGCLILYLWQNENTVVIGKNQNPWAECRCALLEEEGGYLARRSSGGGAVFHDTGNLNFTFLCRTEDFDEKKNLQIVQDACSRAGIHTEFSGRNDLLADGRKFSGNAFYHSGGKSYHHGTLLISADLDKLTRYLTPPKAKLDAKGIASVGARVVNLTALSPTLDCNAMQTNMLMAFLAANELYAENLAPLPKKDIEARKEALQAWDWLYGKTLPCSLCAEAQFAWGHIEVRLQITAGIIQDAQCFTDAMDASLSDALTAALNGRRFTPDDIKNALAGIPYAEELTEMLIKKAM